jgi:hypothetical protein
MICKPFPGVQKPPENPEPLFLPRGLAAALPGETRGPAWSPDVVDRMAEHLVFGIDFGSELLLKSFFCSRGYL